MKDLQIKSYFKVQEKLKIINFTLAWISRLLVTMENLHSIYSVFLKLKQRSESKELLLSEKSKRTSTVFIILYNFTKWIFPPSICLFEISLHFCLSMKPPPRSAWKVSDQVCGYSNTYHIHECRLGGGKSLTCNILNADTLSAHRSAT